MKDYMDVLEECPLRTYNMDVIAAIKAKEIGEEKAYRREHKLGAVFRLRKRTNAITLA